MGLFMLALASSEAPAQAVAATRRVRVEQRRSRSVDVRLPSRSAPRRDAPDRDRGRRHSAAARRSPLYATKPVAVTALPPATRRSAGQRHARRRGARRSSQAAPAIAREAAWLYRNGWPLYALVDRYGAGAPLDEQANCIAVAVYHEARGESLEGQLAVARVIMNRAASGKYPPSWCGVGQAAVAVLVRQSAHGQLPGSTPASTRGARRRRSPAWRSANAVPSLSNDVLWYHADYVAPSWGRRLTRVEKIGAHIFYRA